MSNLTEIELSGLIGSSPIGAMAAFGLFRLCSEIEPLSNAKLSWRRNDDWFAILSVSKNINEITLIHLLNEHLAKQSSVVFEWSEDVRCTKQKYQEVLFNSIEKTSLGKRRFCDYLAAFGSEMAVDNSKGLVKPTLFYMTSGQQSFLGSAIALIECFRQDQSLKINEALFGPWLYQDKQHALGWDPAAERMYALRHKKPGDEVPTSVSAAIRLALEALPLYPVFPDKYGRLHTSGFVRSKNRENIFQWPLWQVPISFDAFKTLLATDFHDESKTGLILRGINALYESIRSEFGQGYGIFRPAQLVWQKF